MVSGQQHAPATLHPRERPGTHFTGGWVDPRAGLDGRKISSSPGFDPGPSKPVAQSLYRLNYRAHSIRMKLRGNQGWKYPLNQTSHFIKHLIKNWFPVMISNKTLTTVVRVIISTARAPFGGQGLLSQCSHFLPSASFHQCSIPLRSSNTDAIQPNYLTAPLHKTPHTPQPR